MLFAARGSLIASLLVLASCTHSTDGAVQQTPGSEADVAPPPVAVADAAPAGPKVELASATVAEPPAPPEAEAPPRLAAPTLETWPPLPPLAQPKEAGKSFDKLAIITVTGMTAIYEQPNGKKVIGYTGIGNRLPAQSTGDACGKGKGEWLKVTGDGYLCSSPGVVVKPRAFKGEVLDALGQRRVPKLYQPTPYRHLRAQDGTQMMKKVPSAEELAALEAGTPPKGLVTRKLRGTFMFAITKEIKNDTGTFYETLEGDFLREDDVAEHFPEPAMRGEHPSEAMPLPIAFVFQDTELLCVSEGEAEPCGVAEKHARFSVKSEQTVGGQALLLLEDGKAVRRDDVRIASKIERPKGVGADEQWMHIDLTEQAIVAYQGDVPVLATLVASGKEGWETPNGLYRTNRVYQTKTMNGVDELGPYQVQRVPWTMYFRGNYALHGAYWHNGFGGPRSHGCVNVPPADARFMFDWVRPQLPQGWTANLRASAPRIYITGKTPPAIPQPAPEKSNDLSASR